MEKKQAPNWEPFNAVPSVAPPPQLSHPKYGKPSSIYPYYTKEGPLAGYACRFNLEGGGKVVLPCCYGLFDGKEEIGRASCRERVYVLV